MTGHNSHFDWSLIFVILTLASPTLNVKVEVVSELDRLVPTLEAHKIILALHRDQITCFCLVCWSNQTGPGKTKSCIYLKWKESLALIDNFER